MWVLSFMALPQGCGVVVPNRGFLMNNELTDFDPLPLNPLTGIPGQNRPEGGKKPRRTALGDAATTIGGEWGWVVVVMVQCPLTNPFADRQAPP